MKYLYHIVFWTWVGVVFLFGIPFFAIQIVCFRLGYRNVSDAIEHILMVIVDRGPHVDWLCDRVGHVRPSGRLFKTVDYGCARCGMWVRTLRGTKETYQNEVVNEPVFSPDAPVNSSRETREARMNRDQSPIRE